MSGRHRIVHFESLWEFIFDITYMYIDFEVAFDIYILYIHTFDILYIHTFDILYIHTFDILYIHKLKHNIKYVVLYIVCLCFCYVDT